MRTCEEHGRGAIVVYDCSRCPVCEEVDRLKDLIDEKDKTIESLADGITE